MKKAFITGVGLLTPAGANGDDLWKLALRSESYIENGQGRISNKLRQEVFESTRKLYPHIPLDNEENATFYSLKALSLALEGHSPLNKNDTLILATTSSLINSWENTLHSPHAKKHFQNEPFGMLLNKLSHILNFEGRKKLINTACCGSTQALILAKHIISSGLSNRCIVGTTETLNNLSTQGFSYFKLLSKERSLPFDESRNGINLSEASVFFIVESEQSISNKKILAEIKGGASFCDAYHMTAPHPEGLGCQKAMQVSLKDSQLKEEDIDWLHAHGTGSLQNDLAEGCAIAQVFKNKIPKISSTKHIHGHALAASGALEISLCLKSLEYNTLLPSFGIKNPDKKIPIANHVLQDFYHTKVQNILKTSLGFGGVNAAIILGKVT